MPIVDNYGDIAKRMNELKNPPAEVSITEMLMKAVRTKMPNRQVFQCGTQCLWRTTLCDDCPNKITPHP